MFKVLLWINFGKESINVSDSIISIKRRLALGIKNEQHQLSQIRNIRTLKEPSFNIPSILQIPWHSRAIYAPIKGGRIAFDIGTQTHYIGNFLRDEEVNDLFSEVYKRTSKADQLTEIKELNFKKIKTKEQGSQINIKYNPPKDKWGIIATSSWWVVWTFISIVALQNSDHSTQLIYILPSVSFLILVWIISSIFKKESISIKNGELSISKPFQFALTKNIKLNSISNIEFVDDITLQQYWSIGGKTFKNRTFVAKLGNRISIKLTDGSSYNFGKGLSFPEGQYIEHIINGSQHTL